MHNSLVDLQLQLYKAAQDFHQAGAQYYATLIENPIGSQSRAAKKYRTSTKIYAEVLDAYEQHLLSSKRNKQMEKELVRIQLLKQSVSIVLNL
jgi:hypothetical protein